MLQLVMAVCTSFFPTTYTKLLYTGENRYNQTLYASYLTHQQLCPEQNKNSNSPGNKSSKYITVRTVNGVDQYSRATQPLCVLLAQKLIIITQTHTVYFGKLEEEGSMILMEF